MHRFLLKQIHYAVLQEINEAWEAYIVKHFLIPAAMIQGSTPTLEFSGKTLISQSSCDGVSFSPIFKHNPLKPEL